jgi:hypothetical protein
LNREGKENEAKRREGDIFLSDAGGCLLTRVNFYGKRPGAGLEPEAPGGFFPEVGVEREMR